MKRRNNEYIEREQKSGAEKEAFRLLCPIHFPDGTEATVFPGRDDLIPMFTDYFVEKLKAEGLSLRKEGGSGEDHNKGI